MAESGRTCASCGSANEEDARFCEGCGASLTRVCAACGLGASATARFCRGCGTPLDVTVAQDIPVTAPVRKTVTVMFADLAGSTTFEERVDAETAREVIRRYHGLLRSTVERHRAGVTKYIGDGFMAVWGVPEIGADDAAHAVDTAVELQERFVELAAGVAEAHGVELALRVAVNTGEVVVGADDADIVGDALNVGARLESECPRGRVVVGEETWRATRGRYAYESRGQVQVKGRTAPVAVYQWLGRESESADSAPFVGRSDEIRRLQAVLDEAQASRAARLVTVIGDPGVGKSRLATEFMASQEDTPVLYARCTVEVTVALAPLVELLRARDLETELPAGVAERDRLLRDLNGLTAGVPGSVEENFWALRRFVEVLAWDGPVVLVLDDIQWADTLLLDFIEHMVEWAQEAPVVILALARPELREIRPDLVTVSRWVSEAVHLDGLDAEATAELAAKVLGASALPNELLRRLPASTGGNPLFVRELIGMLAYDGVLVEQPGEWRLTIDVDAIAIPPTIHALLASRLERLEPADRRVLEIASVIGGDFSLGAVQALADGDKAIILSCNRLRRLELVQPSGTYVGDEPVWRFHHVLIRDVAYRRLLKSDRAELHERLAEWMQAGGSSVAFDPDEMVARHLEAAHMYRQELGLLDERTGDLAVKAARHYAASARRALDRDELVSAGAQAARGAALGVADAAVRAELLLIGCEAFLSAGDVAAGAPLVDDLDRIAGDTLAPWATCYRSQFVIYTDPERLLEIEARLQDAIDEFTRRADPAGLAKAHRVRASARFRLGRVGDGEVDLFEALIAARHSGDHRQITAALGAAPGAALWGPSPVPKAGGRCLDVVRMQRMTTAAPSLEATSLRHLAVLELLRGRPDKARTMLADARQIVEDLGLRHGLMETELFAGFIELMEGDPVAAEPHFRTAVEGLDALGAGADAGQAAALLTRSVLAQGRIDDADRYASESEQLAGRNLKTAVAWRAVRAEILSTLGRHPEAAAMASDAVAVAAETDLVLDHAEACLALSRVLNASGDINGANAARADAESLYAAKEVARATVRAGPTSAAPPGHPASTPVPSRLAVTNQSCEFLPAFIGALHAQDVDGAVAAFSDRFVYDDRRRLGGDPILGLYAMRRAIERIFGQYNRFEFRVLAVRGQRLNLLWSRWSDHDGNETTTLYVNQTDDDGRIEYHGRFDEDDFESAYRELERRYYTGEGSAFAEHGLAASEAPIALNQGAFDRLIGELCVADMQVENRSRSAFPHRSAGDLRATFGELDSLLASSRTWMSAVCWLSPAWSITRLEREGIGQDGELYTWTRVIVAAHRDGRIASMCEFDLEDEDAAFAYADKRVRAATSRLAVTNQACERVEIGWRALQTQNIDNIANSYADQFVYDDRRRLTGDPIEGAAALQAASVRLLEQYPHVVWRTLAVRGERLELRWSRVSDEAGNETSHLHVFQIDEQKLIAYHGRFDEDDFEGAYRELERRYYAGEGSAYAQAGTTVTEWALALTRADLDTLFDEILAPDLRVVNRSRSAFPDRSAREYRTTLEELAARVESARSWVAAVQWLSPTYAVLRCERDALGRDGEHFAWSYVIVLEVRNGRITSMYEFDDEEPAFAYAEERVRPTSRLAVSNRASEVGEAVRRAMQDHDVDAAAALHSDRFVYDDRRHLTGDPLYAGAGVRAAFERVFAQYTKFETGTLAVRGENLVLGWGRWANDAGFETTHLSVIEVSDDGRIEYHGRFDEDDFEIAYRELERRYYAGEAAEFAEAGSLGAEYVAALNQGNIDRLFSELTDPGMQLENRSRSALPDRSITQFRASLEELNELVASARTWNSAMCWLAPTLTVFRQEREAVGRDGESYAWTRLMVCEIHDGRMAHVCEFDVDDENAAFAYAEERMRAITSRLAVTNRSCQTVHAVHAALRIHDVDGIMRWMSDALVYDDRRQLSGALISSVAGFRTAFERILARYSIFEMRILAVRGDRLNLHWTRWSDNAGNETAYLHVVEIDNDGRQAYEGRFDEGDFENAYLELERRYYAFEGAAFAESGSVLTDWVAAVNLKEFDRAFGELVSPRLHIENRSRAPFPNRSAAEARAAFESLTTEVASVRLLVSVVCWLSPTLLVLRTDRDAAGPDGEYYAWTWLSVTEIREGQVSSICTFDVDDEDSAFAYAEETMRATASRLSVDNRATRTRYALGEALRAGDAECAARLFTEDYIYDDQWAIGGDPPDSVRTACERILQQYTAFEGNTLAVRGDSLQLSRTRWSNDAGYETRYLHVLEVDDDGRIGYYGRFGENDFEGAYRELERRFYAGEGSAFAGAGRVTTEFAITVSQGDLDRLFGDLITPDFHVENRSRSALTDRSAAEFRDGVEQLMTMVESARTWNSAVCWLSPTCAVGRNEREAIGRDGERYAWSDLEVFVIRDGRIAAACMFEVEDEEAAFAYAEELVRATASRLAVTNRAARTSERLWRALHAREIDAAVALFADSFVYDDHRRLSGNPLGDTRAALERLLEDYSSFECRTLAVRGESLNLGLLHWSNEEGFEVRYLMVHEVDHAGCIIYHGRFDEDDFQGAYRELDRRYYANEGAAFADAGDTQTEWLVALNRGDLDRLFGELTAPDLRFEMRSSSPFPEPSTASARAAIEDFTASVSSSRTWHSQMCWVSPTCCVCRNEREAVGLDGEPYAWSRLSVVEFRGGRMTSECEFDVDDEEAAFAYAEERAHTVHSRLALTNRSCDTVTALQNALCARDVEGGTGCYAYPCEYDDRRRLGGDRVRSAAGLRLAGERILAQYNHFEWRTLAVRGNLLSMHSSVWSDDSGNETSYLHVYEVDHTGHFTYEGRFDEDDFESAYRELTRRYCAGEGAAVADGAAHNAEFLISINRRAWDRAFNEFTDPDMYAVSRSRSGFPDRSVAELRASYEDLCAMVDRVRSWHSAEYWLSPSIAVIRHEREATGRDGERYTWTRIIVGEQRDGRTTHLCEFDVDDEDAAFAYADQLVRRPGTSSVET
ncbi:adenylate cyclase [Mycobacterium sp. GA-1199]|uniref:adenylate/guanylate cyclase domain-containing protein n=1 Tax=Mycobacterium sp. GA-1199 TaxID=1772287 RepID=UPI000747B703|nr:adenylate/guanylate cyclase domain-containing protein [Mycobacterium sp. GA-1199]KUI40636.1 adenylate cyclase [Mycobacterium sp. GA-1199]